MTAADGDAALGERRLPEADRRGGRRRHPFDRAAVLRQSRRGRGRAPAVGRRRSGPPRDRGDPHAGRHRRARRAAPAGTASASVPSAARRPHRLARRRHHARARAPGEHLPGAAERHRLSRPCAGRLLLARAGRAHPLPERDARRMDRHRPRRVRARARRISATSSRVEGLSVIQGANPGRADAEHARRRSRAHRRHAAAGPAHPSRAGGAGRHGRRVAHARPRHAAAPTIARPGASPRCASRASSTTRRWRSPRSTAPGRIALTNARFVMLFGNARRRRAGELAELVQESDRAGARRGDRRGDRRAERDPGRRRRARRRAGAAARASSSARSWKAMTARTPRSSTRWTRPSSGRSNRSSRRARRCRRSASSPAASRTTSTTC